MSDILKDAYKEFYEHSQDGILIIENNMFIDCNKSIVKMLGYKNKKELLNVHPSSLSPEFQPDGESSYDKAQKMMQLCMDNGENRFDWLHTKANGENFWVEVVLTYLKIDNRDFIHTSWRNIENRKKLESNLENQVKKTSYYIIENEQYKYAIDNYMIVSKTDIEGTITFVNNAFCEISGYSKSELLGSKHSKIRHPDMKNVFFKNLWETITNGKTWTGTVKNKNKNGKTYYVKSIIIPIFDKNLKIKEFISIREDISAIMEEKELAIAYEKSKSLLLSKVSHELRTPLNGIKGFAKILNENNIDKNKVLEYSKLIFQESEGLLKLINNLLDSAKLESEHFSLLPTQTNIYLFLSNEIRFFQYMIQDKRIKFIPIIDINLPEWIFIDSARLKQVLHNLISNALKYTPKFGSIIFEVLMVDNKLEFSIKDTGLGIKKEVQEKIFKAFGQVNEQDQFSGTGLGLSIASSIVNKMGSNICLESVKDKGSSFSFRLKVKKLNNLSLLREEIFNKKVNFSKIEKNCEKLNDFIKHNSIIHTDKFDEIIVPEDIDNIATLYEYLYLYKVTKNDDKDIKQNFSMKVLVAEDYETNQVLIRAILENLGVEVDMANDGESALKLYKQNKYDLIFTDINMPKYDGFYFAKKLSDLNSKTPIYALSADTQLDLNPKYETANFKGIISKPIDTIEIIKILSNLENESSDLNSDVRLSQRLNLPNELIEKLVYTYLKNIELNIDSMMEAYISKNLLHLENITHKVKGSAGTLFRTNTYEACIDIENSLAVGRLTNIKDNIKKIIKDTDNLRNEF